MTKKFKYIIIIHIIIIIIILIFIYIFSNKKFKNNNSTSEVLLVEYDETYQLIEKMIRTITKPFRSKLIHIGMDEVSSFNFNI